MSQTEKEDKLILSRAEDAIYIAERSYQIKTVGFLNPHQRSLIAKNVYLNKDINVYFIGGDEDAERRVMICCPQFVDINIDEIINVIRIKGRDVGKLNHRDYLGSLMGLGITRENIGDILCAEDGAFVFVKKDIASFIMQNLEKIGRHGVKTELCSCSEAELPKPKLKEISGTVSSIRLDAVLSLGIGVSRAKAAELINSGLISLNFEVCESVSEKVNEGDLISARGYGRMRLQQVGGLTRKKRIGITVVRFE